jgi:hypothetical protein
MPGVKIAHVDCTAGDNINRYRYRILNAFGSDVFGTIF